MDYLYIHPKTMPVYRKTTQFSTTDKSPLLDEQATKQAQAITGTFLDYAHAVDPIILPTLNEISTRSPNQQKIQ